MNTVINRQNLLRLVTAVQELSLARDIQTVMQIVRKTARDLTGADGATFVLLDRLNDGEYCYYADEDAIAPLWKGSRFPIQTCVSGWVMKNKQSTVIENIYADERIPISTYKDTFVRSMAMVPIRTLDPVGAIGNYWAKHYKPTKEQLSLLQSLADITAVTLENIKIYAELEQRVKKRTAELNDRNREITDSINCALRIQQAIMPPVNFIQQYLRESFILYKPKDIVAGDFYWFEQKQDICFIAAADCTGHGVPGALVSVVCSNALYRSVNEFGCTDTGKILDMARELVLDTFAKSGDDISDGMDISLCSLNTNTGEICWSGANNNLWYVSNDTLFEIKAHKQAIGKTDEPSPFPTHRLHLKKNDTIYLVTDGFADQFGSIKGKKYKRSRLEQLIREMQKKPMNDQKKLLDDTFETWKGQLEQVDDVTIIGLRI